MKYSKKKILKKKSRQENIKNLARKLELTLLLLICKNTEEQRLI